MKVAIPIDEMQGLGSQVVDHFGRAKSFLICETDMGTFDYLSNPEAEGKTEAPPDFLKRHQVEAVIVFGLGSAAVEKFKNHNITVYKAISKDVKENLEKLESGSLDVL